MTNFVIAGDFQNYPVQVKFGGTLRICTKAGFKREFLEITKETVKSYEVVDSDESISATSAVGRAVVGSALFGPVGIAAALSAKKKKSYVVAVEFQNGKRSLMELDKDLYGFFMKSMF